MVAFHGCEVTCCYRGLSHRHFSLDRPLLHTNSGAAAFVVVNRGNLREAGYSAGSARLSTSAHPNEAIMLSRPTLTKLSPSTRCNQNSYKSRAH